jgi:uncharacterized protein YlxW (UPF0749 family)
MTLRLLRRISSTQKGGTQMHSLTKEQKIENLVELINQKKKKVSNLETEIKNLELKVQKLKSTESRVDRNDPISRLRNQL